MEQKRCTNGQYPCPFTRVSPTTKRHAWWRQFARFLGRFSTLFVSLVIAVVFPSGLLAQEGEKGDTETIRFLDQREKTAIVESWTENGIRLKFKGVSSPVYFPWNQLDPEFSKKLRLRYLGKAKPREMVWGYRVIEVRYYPVLQIEIIHGLKLPASEPGFLWIKSADGIRKFHIDSRAHITRIRVNRLDFLTGDQKEASILKRIRPRDASDWEEVGRELIKLGIRDLAINAFRRAEILRRPDLPAGRLYRELIRLRKSLNVVNLQDQIVLAQKHFLSRDIGKVLEILKVVGEAIHEESLGTRIRVLVREIRSWWISSREEQIVLEWGRVMDSLIRAKVADRSVRLEDARSYLQKNLISEVEDHVRRRLKYTQDSPNLRDLWENRSFSDARKHSFGKGSWLRVRPDLGVPELWWKDAEDSSRISYLKGLAIENAYDVFWTGDRNCPTCGGKGALYETGMQGEICPACRGLKIEKVLFYR